MGFQYVNNLPSPEEIKERFPLPTEFKALKMKRDQAISDVLTGKSDKFLVIIGPCSADNEESVSDYVNRLVKVQEKTKARLILVPRIYTNKPRTTGLTSSACDVAVGMKNPTSGDLSVMLNSVVAAQQAHDFTYRGFEVKSDGNPLAHTILRGAVNKHGQCIPNYHYEDLFLLHEMYSRRNLENPACIVDANHSNSNKKYMEQIRITKEVLHSRRHSGEIKSLVKGMMIESYIEPGAQKVGDGCYGKSITDPCLGWDDSERLLYEMAELV